MGTQDNDRNDAKQQAQQPGRPDEKREQRKQGQGQDQGDQGRFMKSDDDVGGEADADGEINQPGQSGNQDRERSGSTRSRNP
jgi:hypothetical protein